MNVVDSPLRLAALTMLSAFVFAGCDCTGGGIPESLNGALGVVDGTTTNRDALYDFGSVFMGQSKTQKVVIRNLGRGDLILARLEKTEGVDVEIGGVSTGEAPLFSIPFERGSQLGSSETLELEVVYRAPQLDVAQIDHEVKLTLRAENAREGEDTAVITLKARAVNGVCDLPDELDFGNVIQDDVGSHSFVIRNPTGLPVEATIGEVSSGSGDHEAFAFSAESIRGTAVIDPDAERQVALEFRPTAQKAYLASVKARASAECPDENILLIGTGVGSVLSWEPAILDFKYVSPGVELTKDIAFFNYGPKDAELSDIESFNKQEFRVVAADGPSATTLHVPKAVKGDDGQWTPGTAKLTVAFKPIVLGIRSTQLRFKTNLAKQPAGFVTLQGFGGGPDIQVTPSPTLNFGKVAWFANANAFQKRKLTVMNVGTAPPGTDIQANLHLENVVIVPGSGAAAGEFSVKTVGYDETTGLVARATKNTAFLEVTITPTSAGKKEATLQISSNDPDESVVEILLSADVVQLPPCQYTVEPTQLQFGLIQPPDYRDLSFVVKNLGTGAGDICLLSGLDLAADSHPDFSLPNGPIDQLELRPGAIETVVVRVHPKGQEPSAVTHISGAVDLYMSSPDRPHAQVALSAQIAKSCLTIAPDELEFGTVQVGCSSATRGFSIYSACPTDVTITGISLQSGGGQPGPEFILMGAPAIPTAGLKVEQGKPPHEVQVRYKPVDLGADTGAIAINAVQNGTNVTYVVPLSGMGDLHGIHTDVYVQDSMPKADILLTIDNSCSMDGIQDELAANFSEFMKYANSAKVDYRIAVTTTDNEAADAQGRFVSGPGHLEKILRPAMPDVNEQFQAKVNVGIEGSGTEMCFEPSLKALTAPLINSENAGFLRDEASLAVVCVMDEEEQSPLSATYYLNAFLNIKGHNRRNMFSFNAIAGFSAACPFDDGTLANMVTQTEGVMEDICNPAWADALEELGKKAFGFRTKFFLTSAPDLSKGPVQVAIDGQPLTATDIRGAQVWTYDSVDNSVNFEPMYVPQPGQTMTLTYNVTCYP